MLDVRRVSAQTRTPEETMKIRTVVTIVGLEIGFALPALGQEQNTVDPEVRQQIEAVTKRREDAYKI
jgi:hypothetical protein